MQKRIITLFILALVALIAAACGGGGASEEAADAPQLIRESVIAKDSFDYEPGSMTVPEGANVTIELVNEGALEHSWVLMTDDVDAETATEEDALDGITSGSVAGGESERFSFEAPAAGTYQFVCTVPGHAAGGMVGTFTVEASE